MAPLLLTLWWALAWWWLQPPFATSIDASESEASAGRALAALHRVLHDVGPHPVGTPANQLVKDRIIDELEVLGLAPQVQRETVCNRRACATVHNIVARVPGRQGGAPRVALSAHYDSVPAGPGYADDGSGVAAVLEIARVLRHTPAEQSVLLLITDGEEPGLLGATAWLQHPSAKGIETVVNLEARGTSGGSFLFEIAGPTAPMMRAYAPHATTPSVSSLYVSVYRRLPNGTDVTMYDKSGIHAANLGFLANGQLYHTPLDDRAHLSAGSVQHHLDQALGLVRGLTATGATEADGNDVIFDVLGLFIMHYPTWLAVPIAVVALLLTAGGTAIATARKRVTAKQLGLAALIALLPVVAFAGAGWALDTWVAGPGWHGLPWVPTAGMWLLGMGMLLCIGPLVERVGVPAVLAGVSLWLGVAHVALSVLLAEGSYLLLIPTVTTLLGLLLACFLPTDHVRWAAVPASIGAVGLLHLAQGLHIALGLSGLVLLGVASLAAVPAIGIARKESWFPGVIGLVLGGALLALSPLLPAATSGHPQGLVLDHVQLGDDAWVFASNRSFPRGGPLPTAWDLPVTNASSKLVLSARAARSTPASGPSPRVAVIGFDPRQTHLRISAPGSHRLAIPLPNGTTATTVQGVAGPGSGVLAWRGEANELDVIIHHGGNNVIQVFAGYAGLPEHLPQPPPHYVPIHDGWTSWRGVQR